MYPSASLAFVLLLLAGPGAPPSALALPPDPDPCSLVTEEEIAAAAGWTPAAGKPETYGTTLTCTYAGAKPGAQTVVLVLARPAPKVTTSAALAERRAKALASDPSLGIKVTALEGLGVPAIRSEGAGPPTVEAVAGGRLLGVTAPTPEAARELASKAIPRLQEAR
jgi:hypothetical protein